jgi:hypothetical protein
VAQHATQEGVAPPQDFMEMGPTPAEAAQVAAPLKPTARRLNREFGAKEPTMATASREESITPVEMASRMKPMEMGAHKAAEAKRGITEDPWLCKVNPPSNTRHGNGHTAQTDVRGERREVWGSLDRRCPGGGQAWYATPVAKARGAITRRPDRNDTHETNRRGPGNDQAWYATPPPRKRGAPSPAGPTETTNKKPHTKSQPNQA